MATVNSRTIVFIHGLFQNPESWKGWITFFQARGYTCHAPAYPFHDGDPQALRVNPDPELAKLNFTQVVEHYVAFIDALPEKPILIGHSIGGLVVQKLLELGKGVAVASIDPAPPQGIISFQWSFWRANFPTINPFEGNSICIPTLRWFHYAFCNTMTMEETRIEYDKFVVPESRNIPRGTILGQAKIDFKKPHAPLLIIAGEKDHIIPAALNKKNFLAYKDKNSRTDFMQFADRTHYICGQKGWEEVAGYIAGWLTSL